MPEEIISEAAEAAETLGDEALRYIEKLDELLYHHQLTNTILLLFLGCAAGIIVCYILYRFLCKFI